MVKEILSYGCEKCEKVYGDRALAEEHEQIPLIELPKGFIYFGGPNPVNGWIIGAPTGLVDNSSHDVNYSIHSLWSRSSMHETPDRATLDSHSVYASFVRRRLAEEGIFGLRYATDEDVREVLSHERIVDVLDQGLTKLTLDLEGKRTVPILLNQPIPT